MARKAEIGIDYFPLNSDIIHNKKIKLVVAEFGSAKTWAVLLPLYCKIYRENGYWIDWFDEDTKLLFAQEECKLELSLVNELVSGCIRRSLFDKGVFEAFGVLTTDRIQENYLVAKSRNKSVAFIEEFSCKNKDGVYVHTLFDNVNIIDLNVDIIKKKVNTGTQNKKEKQIKEEKGDSGKPPAFTPDQENNFKIFQTYISTHAANVAKMKEPFSIAQYFELKKKFTSDAIATLVIKMHNWKELNKKNVSAYLTFLNWSKKDYNDNPTPEINNAGKLSEAVKNIENATPTS